MTPSEIKQNSFLLNYLSEQKKYQGTHIQTSADQSFENQYRHSESITPVRQNTKSRDIKQIYDVPVKKNHKAKIYKKHQKLKTVFGQQMEHMLQFGNDEN